MHKPYECPLFWELMWSFWGRDCCGTQLVACQLVDVLKSVTKKKEKSERNRRRTQTKNGKWWIGLGFTLSALILCFVLFLVSFVFLMTSLGQPDNERASKEPAVLHLWICTLHFYSRPSLESEYIQLSSPRAGGRFLGHCDIQITSLPCSSW